MKKVVLSMVALLLAGGMYAQTNKEAEKAAKEAEKAAKAAEKQANKEAIKMLEEGLSYYDAAKLKFDEINTPTFQQYEKDAAKKQALKDEGQAYIIQQCAKGNPIVGRALATGRIPEKRLFDTWYKRDFMISQVLNAELSKAGRQEPFDTLVFCKLTKQISDACHYEMKYGNPKDDTQKNIILLVAQKFPRIHIYHAYATMFQIQRDDLQGAIEAYDGYKNFAVHYPEIANEPSVQKPETPYSQLAFNIYFTAYNHKDYDTMAKFFDEAIAYDDPQSQEFVRQSSVSVYLQKGDTLGWVKACKEAIKRDPTSEVGETYAQNLLAYYSKKGVNEMGAFADEMLALSPNSKIANYGKGFYYFAAQKYEQALPYYEKTAQIDPEYMDGNYQAGLCLYQIALNNYRTIKNKKYSSQAAADKESEAKVKSYFRKAAPYFEKVRQLAPNDTDRWAEELRVIYENLGQKAKANALPKLK